MEFEHKNVIYPATLRSKTRLNDETHECVFHVEKSFTFLPGQYVWIELSPSKKTAMRRAFSISTLPNDSGEIRIIVRFQGDSDFHKKFLALKEGDQVRLHGPFGSAFSAIHTGSGPVVLFAGGTGISPFLSVMRALAAKERSRPVTLVYAERSDALFLYRDEIHAWCQNKKDWSVTYIPHDITEADISSLNLSKKADYFISGPQGFVDAANAILTKRGIASPLHFEACYPTAPENTELNMFFRDGHFLIGENMDSLEARSASVLIQMIQNSTNHMVITDLNGRVLFANHAAERITGYALSEILGQTPRLWGGMMSTEFYRNLWKQKKEGKTVHDLIMNRKKNGDLYYALAHIEPLKNASGRMIGFVATEEDVTQIETRRREAEEAQKHLNEKIVELERLNRVMVNRELKMIELKKRIAQLEQ